MNTIDIDVIVNKVIVRDQLSDGDYPRLLDIALDGYKQVFRKVLPNYKTLLLTWDDDSRRMIKYPKDYSKYLIVGVPFLMPNGNMSILTLSRNDDMYFDKPVVCDCTCENNLTVTSSVDSTLDLLETGQTPFTDSFYFGRTYRDGQYVGEMYGLGGGQSYMGSFTPDDANQCFWFGSDVPVNNGGIVLRYKPLAIDYDGQTVKGIPEAAEETLIAWTQWKRLNIRNSGMGERDKAEYRYIAERDDLNNHTNGMTSSEILDAYFEGLTFGIAR